MAEKKSKRIYGKIKKDDTTRKYARTVRTGGKYPGKAGENETYAHGLTVTDRPGAQAIKSTKGPSKLKKKNPKTDKLKTERNISKVGSVKTKKAKTGSSREDW